MHALLCDACRQPIGREGFDVTVLRGVLTQAPGDAARFSTTGAGALSATLCERCGERISAILRRKLQNPCPTCELEPIRAADQRLDAEFGVERRAG